MYSYDDRMKAVKLYVQYNYSYASVRHELGYPKHHDTLRQWFSEYLESSDLKLKSTRKPKFTNEQKQQAVEHYYAHGKCISRTIRMLGFPSRTLLKQWLQESHPEDFFDCSKGKPMVYLSEEQKEQALVELCTRTGTAQDVADKYEVSRYSLYKWKQKLLPEGSPAYMPRFTRNNNQKTESDQIKELTDEVSALAAEAEALKKQIYQLQLEKDVLQKAAEVIKKTRASVLIISLIERRL